MTALYMRGGKRIADVLFSIVAILTLLPVVLVIAVLVRAEDRGPIIFRQLRVGRHLRLFGLLKFRSMHVGVGDRPSAESEGLAVTRIGRILRRTNLDELPQLLNILWGDMSIVGPRPALPTQHRLILLREEAGVYDVRPGLTGLAQVSSYDGMPDETKAAFDAAYLRGMSLFLDARIVGRTLGYLRRPPPVY